MERLAAAYDTAPAVILLAPPGSPNFESTLRVDKILRCMSSEAAKTWLAAGAQMGGVSSVADLHPMARAELSAFEPPAGTGACNEATGRMLQAAIDSLPQDQAEVVPFTHGRRR